MEDVDITLIAFVVNEFLAELKPKDIYRLILLNLESPLLPYIKHLKLPELGEPVGLFSPIFAALEQMISLESLDFGLNYIGPQADMTYALTMFPPSLSNLKILNLSVAGITSPFIEAFVTLPQLSNLTELYLTSNRVGLEGARAISNAPVLSNLKKLDLAATSLHPAAITAIVKSSNLTNLTELSFSQCHSNDECAIAIASSPTLSNLTSLNLYQHSSTCWCYSHGNITNTFQLNQINII